MECISRNADNLCGTGLFPVTAVHNDSDKALQPAGWLILQPGEMQLSQECKQRTVMLI